ncbi:MAG TPA: RtcB family protein [Chthoniobacterales bacterium]
MIVSSRSVFGMRQLAEVPEKECSQVSNLKIIGQHEQKTIAQAQNCLDKGAVRFVLCADGHLGYGHPIGGVAAYRNQVSISGVGYDIACGNMAVKLPLKYVEIKNRLQQIGRKIRSEISFGVGRKNSTLVPAEFLDAETYWQNEATRGLKDLAASQLGTVGSGNHYVDVFHDEEGFVWVGVHFGSRGLGHRTTTYFLKKVGAKDSMDADPCVLNLDSDLGQSYWHAMTLAGKYAYAGREWVCRTVARAIQGTEECLDQVHNHHNFAFLEEHDGKKYVVVRKGATPAFANQRSFVGGSMGDDSVILHGRATSAARENLFSTIHGAGRVMSRTQAAGKFKGWGPKRVRVSEGLVDEAAMRERVKAKGVLLIGAGADEAPECYRKLDEVLACHLDSVAVETRLTPVIVCMAGSNEHDPYKD